MDEKLKEIFTNINDWLKYAEAKSATLIAGNGALIFGVSGIIISSDVKGFYAGYLIMCIVLCGISLSICLLSIIPALNMPWDSKPTGVKASDSTLYFADVAKYTPNAYLKKLAGDIDKGDQVFSNYQKDLAHQIIVNSVIANKKYIHFKAAIWLTLAAVVSPLAAVLIYVFRGKQ